MILERLREIELYRDFDQERFELWKMLTSGDALYRELEAQCGKKTDWDSAVEGARVWYNALRAPTDDFVADCAREFFQVGVLDLDGPVPCSRYWKDLNFQVQKELKERLVNQAQTAFWLVSCARLAATRPNRFQGEIDRGELGADANDLLEPYRGQQDLLWVWVRTFLGARTLARATVDVGVYQEPDRTDGPQSGRSKGDVIQLELEVVEGGFDDVYLHPAAAMTTRLDRSFREAVQQGWKVAREHLPEDRRLGGFGRYRISSQGPGGLKTTYRGAIEGRSAGGAAFRGWWHAMQGKIPDAELIVLATLEGGAAGYQLGQVDGLAAKVEAIARLGRHDTIAVANTADARKVQQILKDINPTGRSGREVVDLSQPDFGAPGGP